MVAEKLRHVYPDITTFGEGGVPFIANTWAMILAPAKAPREIVNRINLEVNRILASPAVREKLEATGVVPGSRSPEAPATFPNASAPRNASVRTPPALTSAAGRAPPARHLPRPDSPAVPTPPPRDHIYQRMIWGGVRVV